MAHWDLEGNEVYQIAKRIEVERFKKFSTSIDCPKCSAPKGTPCATLARGKDAVCFVRVKTVDTGMKWYVLDDNKVDFAP